MAFNEEDVAHCFLKNCHGPVAFILLLKYNQVASMKIVTSSLWKTLGSCVKPFKIFLFSFRSLNYESEIAHCFLKNEGFLRCDEPAALHIIRDF